MTLAVVLAAGACSAGAPGSGAFSVADLVSELPAGQDTLLVSAGDLDAATEAAGLERPGEAGTEEGRQWLLALTMSTESGVFVPPPEALRMGFGQDGGDELGWDLTDVATFADVTMPPRTAFVVTGDFDEDTLSADLDDLGEGVYSAGSGPDYHVSMEDITPVRRVGAPLRLARDDGAIMVDSEEQAVRAWLQGQDRAILGEHQELMGLAESLDAHDVYAATIAETGPLVPVPSMSESQFAQIQDEWQQWAITEPFGTVAVGWTTAEGEPVVLVAYHFADDEGAERGADQVRTLWEQGRAGVSGEPLAQLFTVRGTEIDGPVVVATLGVAEQGHAQLAYTMLVQREAGFGYLQP